MALKSTIYKAEVNIADLDRGYYADHSLTLARHPSETEQRLMIRILAFVLFAEESLRFGKGLSDDDEPGLWRHDLSGQVKHWIEIGLPDERRLTRACGRVGREGRVTVLAYGGTAARLWWEGLSGRIARLDPLEVYELTPEDCASLASLCQRGMTWQATCQDGHLMLTIGDTLLEINPTCLKSASLT